ncbi:MAG TPA: ABC transporter substrate-binding protein [Nevskiaceae bacterium]
MKIMTCLSCVLTAVAMTATAGSLQAKELKIGLIAPFTGPLAEYGTQMQRGMEIYMAQHGDTVAGRKVKVIVRDTTGIAPAIAKREAQELLIQDKVDILAGFGMSPNAFSAAPLATQFKVPMVVMNAATSSITEKSPYIVRTSMTMRQSAAATAQYAYEHGIKRTYVLVADFAPGVDWQEQFTKTYAGLGGEIVGAVRVPVNTVDYAPYLQRVLNAKPDAMAAFVQAGHSGLALFKGIRDVGLQQAGIKLIGAGDLTDESVLQSYGDGAIGYVTTFHYSEAHASPENKAFVAAFRKAYPGSDADGLAVAGYDGMALISKVLDKTHGDAAGPAFAAAAEGMKWESPRGPVEIDPQTRDIIQNEYIRKVERVDGRLQNTEFFVYKAVKDPGKTADNRFVYSGSGPVSP